MEDRVTQEFLKNITIEVDLNKGDELPFGLYNPKADKNLVWFCGEDEEGKITSVFQYDAKEKVCKYLKDMKEAKYMRDEMLRDGWKEVKVPEITFQMGDKKKSFS
jgi:hypothetical protein